VVDEPVARKKDVAPILGRDKHVPSIYILLRTFEQIVVEPVTPNHGNASVGYLSKKPEDPFDGWWLQSLIPLDFLERHGGRDQIDLSVTISCKKPIEGRGLRGILIHHDRADDAIVQVNLQGLAPPWRSAQRPPKPNPRRAPASAGPPRASPPDEMDAGSVGQDAHRQTPYPAVRLRHAGRGRGRPRQRPTSRYRLRGADSSSWRPSDRRVGEDLD
jgi:hypothetical protein